MLQYFTMYDRGMLIFNTQLDFSLLIWTKTEDTLLVESTLAIRVLSMLLPFVPSSLPPLLPRIFSLVARLSRRAWQNTHQPLTFIASKELKVHSIFLSYWLFINLPFLQENQQLNVVVGLLVVYLYGMFPCSFLDFIRSHEDKRLRNTIKVGIYLPPLKCQLLMFYYSPCWARWHSTLIYSLQKKVSWW